MSIKVSMAVWAHSKHSGTHLLVMLALADQSNDDGVCWPAKESIARRCRVSRVRADGIIKELKESGELIVHYRRKGKVNLSNVYQINLEALTPPLMDEGNSPHIQGEPSPHWQGEPPLTGKGNLPSQMRGESSFNHQKNRKGEPSAANAENNPDPLDEIFRSTKRKD